MSKSKHSTTPRLAIFLAVSTLLHPTHGAAEDDENIAVSLTSFIPRLDNLPPACETVYQREIVGCTPDDFLTKSCSGSCVNGLVAIQKAVQESCQDADVESSSVIGAFRAGTGIPYVCNNVVVTTSPASTQSQTSTSAPPPSSTSTDEDGGDDDEPEDTTTSAPPPQQTSQPVQTTQPAASSTVASSTGIVVDTSVPSTFATTNAPAASTTSALGAQSSADTQKSNTDSGGGSPFDVQAVSGASRTLGGLSIVAAVAALVVGVL